jgi:hypothetical protein
LAWFGKQAQLRAKMRPDIQVGAFALPKWAIGLLTLILTGAIAIFFHSVLNWKQV